MGPGCFHPRNGFRFHRSVSRPASFNGAGMFPSQKSASWWCSRRLPSRLQWGRDVSIPEITRQPGNRGLRAGASMGPGCFHPRNPSTITTLHPTSALQWGRDVSIPEIVLAAVPRGTFCRFNGAGMFPSQKSTCAGRLQLRDMRFNGAGMFPSQKCLQVH